MREFFEFYKQVKFNNILFMEVFICNIFIKKVKNIIFFNLRSFFLKKRGGVRCLYNGI